MVDRSVRGGGDRGGAGGGPFGGVVHRGGLAAAFGADRLAEWQVREKEVAVARQECAEP